MALSMKARLIHDNRFNSFVVTEHFDDLYVILYYILCIYTGSYKLVEAPPQNSRANREHLVCLGNMWTRGWLYSDSKTQNDRNSLLGLYGELFSPGPDVLTPQR